MRHIFRVGSILLVVILLGACNATAVNENSRQLKVEQAAQSYFETYSQRTDWEKFCSFYREDVVFDDIMLQLHLDSLWQLKRFYKWDEEGNNFQKLTPDQQHITFENIMINDSMAIGQGHLNPFYYYGELIDPEWGMEVIFTVYFDENLKIYKQVDWIEYDPNVLEGIVTHYKENGFGAIPAWLDLSKD